MIGRSGLLWTCLVCLAPFTAAAQSNGISSVGIYNCYTGMPAEAIPFFQACGYNTYERWDLGWTLQPSSHQQYYADMAQDIQRMQDAGFEAYVLLTTNMVQRREGEPEGYQHTSFDPHDQAAMEERLAYITATVRNLNTADGFTIGAGDPGGHDAASIEDLYGMLRQIISVIRTEAPHAKININTWAISTWANNPSPYSIESWTQEVTLTGALIGQPDLLDPNVNIEFPMHNYYRSLALHCYNQAGENPLLCPTAEQVAELKQRGVEQLWGWPYFLVDECDDGYQPGTEGMTQAETRYIKQTIDAARQLGLNGMVANTMASNILAERLNIYAFGRFCNDAAATPAQVISEFAGFISQPETIADLAQVIQFVENQSTWQSGLPEKYRLPDFDVEPLATAADAYRQLNQVAILAQSTLPSLPGSPRSYVNKLKQRLRILGKESIPNGYEGPVLTRYGTAANGAIDGPDDNGYWTLITTGGEVVNAVALPGSTRGETDAVEVTIENFEATVSSASVGAGTGSGWAVAGLAISASATPILGADDPIYSFNVTQNALGHIRYVLSGAPGFTPKTGPWLSDPPDVIRLRILREGDEFIFCANDVEIFRDSSYADIAMPYYFIEWGSGGGSMLTLNARGLGIVVPEPKALAMLAAACLIGIRIPRRIEDAGILISPRGRP